MKNTAKYIPLGAVTAAAMLLSSLPVQAHSGSPKSQRMVYGAIITTTVIKKNDPFKRNDRCPDIIQKNRAIVASRASNHCLTVHGYGFPKGRRGKFYRLISCHKTKLSNGQYRIRVRGRMRFSCR